MSVQNQKDEKESQQVLYKSESNLQDEGEFEVVNLDDDQPIADHSALGHGVARTPIDDSYLGHGEGMTPNDETLLGHGIGMTPIDDNLESKSAAGATKKLQPGLLKPSDEAPLGTQSPKSRDIGVSEIDFSDIS